jgi:hypothetical protein
MATDIRIQVSFRGHRKRKKLTHILGRGATDHLIDLWIAAAMNKPTGILDGMDDLDVCLEAGWEGEPETFINALTSVGFLEKDSSGVYRLHDWEHHQQWIVKEPARKEKSRKANEKKYGKESSEHPTRNPKIENEDSPLPFPSLPFPSLPKKETRRNFSAGDLSIAEEMFRLIRVLNPEHKQPNLEAWAEEIRLIRERDGKSAKAISDLFTWANGDDFWKRNILSPATLRKQWDKLMIQRKKEDDNPEYQDTEAYLKAYCRMVP